MEARIIKTTRIAIAVIAVIVIVADYVVLTL